MSKPKAEAPKFFGKYRGIVKDNKDPDKLGRLRAMVAEVSSEEPLDWALPVMPYGALQDPETKCPVDNGMGIFAVPEMETGVWVEFEAGDINRPLWCGTWHATPKNAEGEIQPATVPKEAFESEGLDGEGPDYPKEKVFKSERVTVSSSRRTRLKVDSETSPFIDIGRPGTDAESETKNTDDIEINSRDAIVDAGRDINANADRDICLVATEIFKALSTPLTGEPPQPLALTTPAFDSGLTGFISQFESQTTRTEISSAGPVRTYSQASDIELSAGDGQPDIGGSIVANATNGFFLQAFGNNVGFPPDLGPGQGSYSRGIHLHLRNLGIPSNSLSDAPQQPAPIELGRPTTTLVAPHQKYLPSQSQPGKRTFLRLLDERAVTSYNAHVHDVTFTFDIPTVPVPPRPPDGPIGGIPDIVIIDEMDWPSTTDDPGLDVDYGDPGISEDPDDISEFGDPGSNYPDAAELDGTIGSTEDYLLRDRAYRRSNEGLSGWLERAGGTDAVPGAFDLLAMAMDAVLEIIDERVLCGDETFNFKDGTSFYSWAEKWTQNQEGLKPTSVKVPNFSRDMPYGRKARLLKLREGSYRRRAEPLDKEGYPTDLTSKKNGDEQINTMNQSVSSDFFEDALPLPFGFGLGTDQDITFQDVFPGEPTLDTIAHNSAGVGGSRGRFSQDFSLDGGGIVRGDLVTVSVTTSPPLPPEKWETENFDLLIGRSAESPTNGSTRKVTTEFTRAN